MPSLISTALGESDIIFGGEDALRVAIRHAADTGISAIFVLSTCIAILSAMIPIAVVCRSAWVSR